MKIRTIYFFNLLWLIFIIYIVSLGLQPYPHYITGELRTADFESISIYCALGSLYFIAGNIIKIGGFWDKDKYLSYIFLSAILIFMFIIALSSAMHAPPFIGAYIVSCLILMCFHFILYLCIIGVRKMTQSR